MNTLLKYKIDILLSGFLKRQSTKHFRRSVLLFLSFYLFSGSICVNAQTIDYGNDTAKYTWLHPELNMFQFYSRKSVETIHKSWKQAKSKKIVMVYCGDSHVQSDVLPGEIRKDLQAIHGDGGRGLIFPGSVAKTYSYYDCKTSFTGKWEWGKALILPSKVPLGVVGMSCRTEFPDGSFTFDFTNKVPDNYNLLRIFCKMQHRSFDLEIEAGGKKIPVSIDSTNINNNTYIDIAIPPAEHKITIHLIKNKPYQNAFEFYGMSLECAEDKGFVVHNAGVGGARYHTILYEDLFVKQLPALKPDIVVIDYGTNDILYEDRIDPSLESDIRKVIAKVREASPDVTIILTSAQDMYRRGICRTSSEIFSDLVRSIAKETNCAFYDWYWISGGYKTLKIWKNFKLAQPDLIHLTMKGYRLKGKMFCDALIKTMDYLDTNPAADSLVCNIENLKGKEVEIPEKIEPISKDNKIIYVIKSGDNLGAIAIKYHVTVAQLMEWNKLKTSRIGAGKTLIIYSGKK